MVFSQECFLTTKLTNLHVFEWNSINYELEVYSFIIMILEQYLRVHIFWKSY